MTIIEHGDDDESEQEPPRKRGRVFASVCLALVLTLAGAAWFVSARPTPGGTNITLETARSAYLGTQSETHTGRRLARLEDYLVQFQGGEARDAARMRRDVLRAYEHSAWATFTKARYDLDIDEDAKALALTQYLKAWGSLTRQGEIDQMNAASPDDDTLDFAAPQSKYAAEGDTAMVGDTTTTESFIPPVPPPITQPKLPTTKPPSKMRIRSDRSPSYPKSAKRRGIEAVVVLALDIDDKGKVRRTQVVRVDATRYQKDFAKAAERAARRTRFYPMQQAGKPVPVQGYKRTYRFQIGG